MPESLKFSGNFESGVKYEIHTSTSFSGMEELAVIVEGKPITIITVSKKRNGSLEIKPVLNQKAHIPGSGSVNPPEAPAAPKRPGLKED
jgi:hypothetical protein